MTITQRRLPAVLLAVLLALSTSPAAATDPSPAPSAPETAPEPASAPTVHAEMLSERAGIEMEFPDGAQPGAMAPADVSVQSLGAVTALPNGMKREVYGYLPYWALSTSLLQNLNYDLLTTIAYFGVPVQSNRLLRSGTGWSGWMSAHMTDVINRAHAKGVEVHLTVTMMAWNYDYTAMGALLNSPTNRAGLASDIAATVVARNADGVNLDFEPMPNSLQSQYTTFVREVKAALVAAGAGSYLTVATTGGAASWDEGYDLPALTAAGAADAIMVMGYDFNWGGSARAGGVAPIDSPYVLDVRDAMAAFTSKVPASQLIWGVPYYGRAWTTESASVNARTCKTVAICPTGQAAAGAFGRTWVPRYVDALEPAGTYGRLWDATGQVPWYRYQSSTYGTWVQGYYEDAQSLRAKYAMVNTSGLRGVGIWHLLMDVNRTELWNELARGFADLPFIDIAGSEFRADIVWLVEAGITQGCGSGLYCPRGAVTRDQMASFLARARNLPAATADYFTDDTGSTHEADINRAAAAGITVGCGGTEYCPGETVTRDQMASFLARALNLPAATTDYFTDDTGSTHEADINRVAVAGITLGCGAGTYCPTHVVTREQMAAFLHRALE